MDNEANAPTSARVSGCLAPELGKMVYDYVDGMLSEEEGSDFEAHLLRCDKCYQMTITLDWLHETLRSKLEEEANPSKSSCTLDPESALVNHTNNISMSNPLHLSSSPAFYFVIGGLSVLGLVALGVVGFTKFSKLKRSLLARREAAQSQASA
jgi:hypothetical protein